MRLLHHLTLFATMTLFALGTMGGCSNIAEAIDCDEMCTTLHDCVDSDISVHRCAERCEDRVDDNPLSEQLDRCTDCLEGNYACAEISQACPMCEEVSAALLD